MYYICKFSDTWAVYDEKSNRSRQLLKEEVDALKSLFPLLFQLENKMLAAVKVENISPNKLLKLPFSEKPTNIPHTK